MTALAAIWTGVGDISSARSLERMLDAQALYGSGARQRLDHGDAAVGIMLRALLPEDRFDRQPLALQAGRFSFVADLRLDNRAELIAALSPRTDAAQLSDAAIAGLAFEAWEEKSFDRLRGDFAIIVWDAAKHRFILARDGFGTRPLYFHHRPGLMAAASMPKGLNALEHMPRRPDIDFIEASAQRMSMYGDGTFWLGIRRVLPGHYAVVSADAVQQTRYWQPEIRLLKLRNHAEYAEALRERIDHAVRVRLLPSESNGKPKAGAKYDWGADFSARLARQPLHWDLQLQYFTNERQTPIEDASVNWDTPYVTVARLMLPAQDTASAQGQAFSAKVEASVIDPWQALAAHRPLGDVQRARKVVYFASQKGRGAA